MGKMVVASEPVAAVATEVVDADSTAAEARAAAKAAAAAKTVLKLVTGLAALVGP